MARSEARLKFGIWRGLHGASAPAKLLYCVLLTDDSVNYAGVGRYCPELWAENAEMPLDRIEKALGELVAQDWVAVDGFSFLIRTMIRNDGVADQPNILKAALREAQQVHSQKIRKLLAAELRKLPPKRRDTVTGGKTFTHPDPHAVADELDPPLAPRPPSGASPDGFAEGSETVPDPWENPSSEPFQRTLPAMASANGSGEGFAGTPGGRGGGRGRGVPPVTENSISTEPPTAGDKSPPADESPEDNRTPGQHLVGYWLDLCRKRPPGTVIGQTGKAIAGMLDEGIADMDIRTGIETWAAKGLHPSALPAVVNEVMNSSPAALAVRGGGGRHLAVAQPQGTASQRAQAFLNLRTGESA